MSNEHTLQWTYSQTAGDDDGQELAIKLHDVARQRDGVIVPHHITDTSH
jgi:hypothetical protein